MLGALNADLIDDNVIRMIARRDDLSQAAARERAEDIVRLARMRRRVLTARSTGDRAVGGLDRVRAVHLTRAALARLWLTDVFEPSHLGEHMPAQRVAANLERPVYFHERLHVLCNLIVVPSKQDAKGRHVEAPDAPRWHAQAKRFLEPIARRIQRHLPDPSVERDCGVLQQLVQLEDRQSDDGQLTLRLETGLMSVCREDLWDPRFVAALCDPAQGPGWFGPFSTGFGVHLVAVLAIKPENRPDKQEREAFLRATLLDDWRAQALQHELDALRRTTVHILSVTASAHGDVD